MSQAELTSLNNGPSQLVGHPYSHPFTNQNRQVHVIHIYNFIQKVTNTLGPLALMDTHMLPLLAVE
jgi:hypothetical protein